jgi:predicted DNA-binding helix-hairpin-helix protein
MVPRTKLSIDVADLRDLIVPGLGNRRIFRILLTDACRHACEDCPMRAERDLPPNALDAARLARLFMTAFRRGWCDGLFITSGIPKDAVRAMDRMLEVVELLRVAHGYRGYLHVKAVAGAEAGQIERLVRLVDRVSYNLEARCRRAQEENSMDPGSEKQAEVPVFELAAAAAVREARRDSARKAPPGLPPVPAERGNRARTFAALRGQLVRPRPAQATLFPATSGVLSRPWGLAPGIFR